MNYSIKACRASIGELLSIIGTLLSLVSFDLVYFLYPDSFLSIPLIMVYVICFSWYIFVSGSRNVIFIFLAFILIKCFVLILSIIDNGYLYWVMFNGDAFHLHIPTVLGMKWGNILPYLSDVDTFAVITGRITHVFYFLFWTVLSKIFYFPDEQMGVMIVAYIANTFVVLYSGLLINNCLKDLRLGSELVSKGVCLYLLSPFIIAWGSMAMKEPIITMLVVIVSIQIFRKGKLLLIFTSTLFIFERLYMVYFPAFIFLLTKDIRILSKLLILLTSLAFMFFVFPMEMFLGLLFGQIGYQSEIAMDGGSLFQGGILFDFLRTIFSPAPIAAFSVASSQDFFYRAHYLFQPIYIFIMFRLMVSKSRFSVLIISILLINMILFPYGARQKITLLIPLLSLLYPIFLHCKRNNLSMSYFWKI